MNGSVVMAKMAGIESTAKDQVGDFDQDQHQEERRRIADQFASLFLQR